MRATHDPTAAVKGSLLPVKVTNRAAITDEHQFGQFLRDLDAYTGAGVIKDAILFQILTMTRPGEARGASKKVRLEAATLDDIVGANENASQPRHSVVETGI